MVGETVALDRVATLTNADESETLEFKATIGTRRDATRTVWGMLNHGGGQVPSKLMREELRVEKLELCRLMLRRILVR